MLFGAQGLQRWSRAADQQACSLWNNIVHLAIDCGVGDALRKADAQVRCDALEIVTSPQHLIVAVEASLEVLFIHHADAVRRVTISWV